MINNAFWSGKKVFLTGHTGFKGAWLCLWLHSLGAKVTGYALQPPSKPNLFELARVDELIYSVIGDITDGPFLKKAMMEADPDIVIHMAAQPLVRESYLLPVETYATNVMGTVHLLEAVRSCRNVKAVVNVTTDKCYENKEWVWGYRENEPMGGYDPYSNSKACSELVTSAYRSSYFNPSKYEEHGVALASARAGNVIGGGDWATDRLIPDCVRSLLNGEKIVIRNPSAIRPWQHVLEPLSGYLLLAEKLFEGNGKYAEGWNFGPNDDDAKPVEWIVRKLCEKWPDSAGYNVDNNPHPHEANFLKLDCSKAKTVLGWHPAWSLDEALSQILKWVYAYRDGEDMRKISMEQIAEYTRTKTYV
ncbi:CDP-glucose 4,6-dehydratase [Paenibacillus sp.]|uniref:CDP-glucose 4,6-dehydratase n=1 Tax=Paenibacillus sp. TaxID=58172 RepID=UPI002D2E4AB5|nr:CDP-glucose 4,6-dehydratase [Paenibacillus sp.]HZG86172.1 CDP-glucose 4,6-dehydratase [Paenibacillus sp.]